jgi:hypothetical protein
MSEVFAELSKRKDALYSKRLASSLVPMPTDTRRTIRRGMETGMWLTLAPSTVNGTELSAQEFRDHLFLRYDMRPPDLPTHCDECSAKFDMCHTLQCKKGGLVIMRHNKIKDELCDLLTKALVPSAVRDEPRIHPLSPSCTDSCQRRGCKIHQSASERRPRRYSSMWLLGTWHRLHH